jgi:hypothetical protein
MSISAINRWILTSAIIELLLLLGLLAGFDRGLWLFSFLGMLIRWSIWVILVVHIRKLYCQLSFVRFLIIFLLIIIQAPWILMIFELAIAKSIFAASFPHYDSKMNMFLSASMLVLLCFINLLLPLTTRAKKGTTSSY